jgi:membrane protein implicated in regulation of membrane protease activity
MAVLFWVVIMLFCIAAEVHTNAFLAIFIGIGAVVAFIMALAGAPFALQAVFWLVISVGGILSLRPFALRKFGYRSHEFNMSRPAPSALTDLKGIVESPVGDEQHPGRVKIRGESWKAVTDWPEAIPDGTQVVVRKTYGTTLWVDPL